MKLGYRVSNLRTDLHPGALLNYYGGRRSGSPGGHSIIFLRYDQSFSISRFIRNIVFSIFGNEKISTDAWYERSGIVAISQGDEKNYSFGYLESKGATGANWLPTQEQVK